MLYKIRGTSTFLAGSVHFLPANDAQLPAALLEAHRNAETVAFEWHLDGTGSSPPSPLLDAGIHLGDIVPATTLDAASALWQQLAIAADLSTLKPWAATQTTLVRLIQDLALVPGVDLQLWKLTEPRRRQVLDDEHAVWAFERAATAELVAGFQRIISDPAEGRERLTHIIDGWRVGGDEGIVILTDALKMMRDLGPTVARGLVDDRNAIWLPKILRIASMKRPALVLVGALHLIGPKGLLTGLRHAGMLADPV